MFRLIAAALVLAYAVLALTGSAPSPADPQAGIMAMQTAPARDLRVGSSYVVAAPVRLRQQPGHDQEPLARLGPGAAVIVLSGAPSGFAEVRDDAGRTGYIPAAALSEAL